MIKIIIIKKNSLGKIGNILNVKLGYARNYLIPYNFALYATKNNINKFNRINLIKDIKDKNKKKKLHIIYKNIILLSPIKLYYKCSKNGKLFDSLNSNDISNIISKKLNYKLSKKSIILLNGPIKFIGKHLINISLNKKKIDFYINIIAIK